MTEDDLIKLVFQVTGSSDIDGAAAKVRGLKSATDDLAPSVDQASSKVANFGQVGLQSGRIIQDFAQGGAGGVLNNIEGITMALGGGAGLAGALTALGVAFFILKPHINTFMEQLGLAATKTEADRMKELADNTHRTAEETATLNKYKKEQADIEAQMAMLPKAEKDRKTAVAEAIGERGVGSVVKALVESRYQGGDFTKALTGEEQVDLETQQARVAKMARSGQRDVGAEARIEELRRTAQENAIQQAKKDIVAAGTDTDRQKGLANELKGIKGLGQLGYDIGEATPEKLKAAHIEEANRARANREARDAAAAEKARRARGERFARLNEKEQDELLKGDEDAAKDADKAEKKKLHDAGALARFDEKARKQGLKNVEQARAAAGGDVGEMARLGVANGLNAPQAFARAKEAAVIMRNQAQIGQAVTMIEAMWEAVNQNDMRLRRVGGRVRAGARGAANRGAVDKENLLPNPFAGG